MGQLVALWAHSTSCFRWPSLRSSPSSIRCVLGLVLFLIFINNLPINTRPSVRLFADDCVLYRNIHSLQDCLILQEFLTSLGQREGEWQMKFNVAKCHSIRVTRHQHHKQILFDYPLHNQTLENVQSAKYLGITITDNMYWGQHVSEISSKASKTLGFLRRTLAFAPRSTKAVAYKTCSTKSSHSAQYRRHKTSSDALKHSFSPELFHIGIVCLLLWPISSPKRSLWYSLFKQIFRQNCLCLCCCFISCCLRFFYLSKF